jgi:hypothetical protein
VRPRSGPDGIDVPEVLDAEASAVAAVPVLETAVDSDILEQPGPRGLDPLRSRAPSIQLVERVTSFFR